MFLFCESAMIALLHVDKWKKVEAAFFSKYIQGYVQKGEGGWCVRLKNIVITSETKLFRWFWSKGGESLNQASQPAEGGLTGATRPPRLKNQSHCCKTVILQTGALTPQPGGNLQKKTGGRTKSFRTPPGLCRCLCTSPISAKFSSF